MDKTAFPPTVIPIPILPVIGIRAFRSGMGGGFRAWSILRHIDQSGSGIVSIENAEKFAISIGVSHRKWLRWFKEGLSFGFFKVELRGLCLDARQVIILAKKSRVAKLVNCTGDWTKRAEIDSDLLIRHDSLTWVWGAYLLTQRNIPVTRRLMRNQTGVPESNQWRFEHELNIEVIANYAFTDKSPDQLTGFRENCVSYAFVWTNHATGEEFIAYRLGNTRRVHENGIRLPEKKARRSPCNTPLNNKPCGKLDTDKASRVRRYHFTHSSLVSAFHRINKLNIANIPFDRPTKIYELVNKDILVATRGWRMEIV